ncbi:kinase-like protein [Ramaria rubella]|nr:kinase-like protein [Ramaria rubella]
MAACGLVRHSTLLHAPRSVTLSRTSCSMQHCLQTALSRCPIAISRRLHRTPSARWCRVPLINHLITNYNTFASPRSMTPTLGPTPPVPTLPLAPSASAAPLPEPTVQQEVTAEGLRHAADIVLDARQYKSASFAKELLRLLATLRIASWAPSLAHTVTSLKIFKVSGSLTNAVFFISHPGAKTLLLRIYGPSSSSLVSRPDELRTLHVLSSKYGIAPRVYGTFVNGRVEQYFESEALTTGEMRDPQVSAWIAMRMAELHCVDLAVVAPGQEQEGVRKNVRGWLGPAREVLKLAEERGHAVGDGLDLERFAAVWEAYWAWLMHWENRHGKSKRVFAHNDTQYGNLLRLKAPRAGEAAHHKIIVVDFEYASPNAAAFDIGNHFHEWTANYHSDRPHELQADKYPGLSARRNFYVAYLTQARAATAPKAEARLLVPTDDELNLLDAAVGAWSAASHGMWAVWGIVQARDDVESGRGLADVEFDYLGYAASRMGMFMEHAARVLRGG